MALTKTEETYMRTEIVFHQDGEEVYRQTIQDDWLYDETEQPITQYDREEYNLGQYDEDEEAYA